MFDYLLKQWWDGRSKRKTWLSFAFGLWCLLPLVICATTKASAESKIQLFIRAILPAALFSISVYGFFRFMFALNISLIKEKNNQPENDIRLYKFMGRWQRSMARLFGITLIGLVVFNIAAMVRGVDKHDVPAWTMCYGVMAAFLTLRTQTIRKKVE